MNKSIRTSINHSSEEGERWSHWKAYNEKLKAGKVATAMIKGGIKLWIWRKSCVLKWQREWKVEMRSDQIILQSPLTVQHSFTIFYKNLVLIWYLILETVMQWQSDIFYYTPFRSGNWRLKSRVYDLRFVHQWFYVFSEEVITDQN